MTDLLDAIAQLLCDQPADASCAADNTAEAIVALIEDQHRALREAADKLAEQSGLWLNGGGGGTYDGSLTEALAEYRKATE